jgi:hypothetical protein
MRESPRSNPEPRFALDLEYLLAVASAWLLPGAGHWVLGHRVRAVVLGGSILGLFWAGELLALSPADAPAPIPRHPLAVTRQVHPIFFACQVGNGFSTLLANSLWGHPRYDDRLSNPLDAHLPLYLNLGILLTSVSGLLNYLLVLHVLDPRSWVHRKAGARRASPGGSGP